MKNHIIIILITTLTLLHSCKINVSRENEPNNSFSTSNNISEQKSIEGFIDTPEDVDFYRIDVPEDSILDINLSGIKGVNHSFRIWQGAESPESVKWVDDNRKSSDERFVNFFATQGTYYISVFHGERDRRKANSETPYKLTVFTREKLNEEIEPNDIMISANEIQPGYEYSGYYSPAHNRMNSNNEYPHREEDWFYLDINPASTKPVILDVSVSALQGVNPVIYLFNSNREMLIELDNAPTGDGENIVGYGIDKPGKYYIMITSRSYNSNNEEPYFFIANLREHDSSMEMEDNNSFSRSNVITGGQISGKINAADDVDFFRFSNPNIGENSIFRIELQPPGELNLMFSIFNTDERKLYEIDNYGNGLKEVFPNISLSGDFYVSVYPKTRGVVTSNEYKLTVSQVDHVDGYEIEPNDQKHEANTITNKQIKGFISPKNDVDYFYLSSDARVKLMIEITGIKDAEIKVSITDPLGFVIKSKIIKGRSYAEISEMLDRKGYLIVESLVEKYDFPYIIKLRSN